MKLPCLIAVFALISRLLLAQSSAPPPDTGGITGHVTLGDSHLPARMAEIMLLEVPSESSDKSLSDLAAAVAESGTDGSFAIPHVLPGSYYIFAEKSGYVVPAPIGLMGMGDQPASKELKDALASGLSPITVTANRLTTAEIVLHRGAAISGFIRFDDGAPAGDIVVSLLQKDKSGKWTTPPNIGDMNHQATDDQGNFRLAGLPAGEYLLKATLQTQAPLERDAGTDGGSVYQWDIYFGDGVRPRDAKSITLKDGEESSGDNITIPLSRLHVVSGSVISLESGAPVESGHVELHNAADDALDAETSFDSSSGQFRLPFVAEGEYTLKVTHGSDPTPGANRSEEAKPLRTYADTSQALIVKGETSVTIQLKPQSAAPPATVAQ